MKLKGCLNCCHYYEEGSGIGKCFRYPPILVCAEECEELTGWAYPLVVGLGYCGEWKEKSNECD